MNRPFAILEQWVRQGRIHLAAVPALDAPSGETESPNGETRDFSVETLPAGLSDDELDALRALEEFVRDGNVAFEQTAEYIEGSVHPHGRLYLDDLRSGRFSIQAHLDLHGLNLQNARFILGEFLLESVRAGFSCVRVIHGRGRHSHKHHPILKENIQRWLCTRRMSRNVVAYTSARRCDGGGGAVYILL